MNDPQPQFQVGDKIEYLLYTKPDKWRCAQVIGVDERWKMATVKSATGFVTQQVFEHMRLVERPQR